jgi:hypothetical protein
MPVTVQDAVFPVFLALASAMVGRVAIELISSVTFSMESNGV